MTPTDTPCCDAWNRVYGAAPTYSPHKDWWTLNDFPTAKGVVLNEIRKALHHPHGELLHIHLGGSPLRRPFRTVAEVLGVEPFRPFGSWIDSVWCATIGRIARSIGAGEVQIVFQ